MKTCPVCQKLVNDETKFCYYCGASLLNQEAPAPEPVEEPVSEPVEEAAEQPIAEVVEPAAEPEPVVSEPEPEPIVIPEPEPEPQPEPVEEAAPAQPVQEPEKPVVPVAAPVHAEVPPTTVVNATDSRSLMTTAGYIFSTILFHIPVIGLIFLFVWGCGRPKNISLKRYALAWLIMRLLGIILVLSFAVFMLICFSGKFPILTDAFTRFFS